jgi:broad specificity phosphatase PhoE
MPYIERYWANADPTYCDGEGTESFAMLLRRAEATLARLATLPDHVLVYVFSHGQYIQATRSLVLDVHLSDQEKMRRFWKKGEPDVIPNAALLNVRSHDGIWWIE